MTQLVVAPAPYEAAVYAVTHWHYSRKMPSSKSVHFGAWEDSRFIGAVIYGRGANHHMAGQYGLRITEVAELTRVALDRHQTPVTQIVASTLRQLRAQNPGLRLVVSYADTAQGHLGVIYQAGGWIYTGPATPQKRIRLRGRLYHKRTVSDRYGRADMPWLRQHIDPAAVWVPDAPKHQYVMPLDRAMRRRLRGRAVPFPRAAEGSEVSRPPSGGKGRVRSPAAALIS